MSAVCDRVVIINKGNIKAVDTIENLEKKLGGSLTLRIKIKGDRTKTSNIIELTDGVQEIASIDAEGNDFYAFAVKLREGAGDDVKNNIMAELIKHGIQISEIYTEKPDLEAVFVDMINRSAKNNGLLDLLDEIEPVEAPETEDDEESAADEEKEDKE